MGIRGLTSYINASPDLYLRPYDLHNTYLVIDASSVSCQIYSRCTKVYSGFGGDYDAYAEDVREFFDKLLKCKVTPLVLFDGGVENRKMRTIVTRTKEKIRASVHYSQTQIYYTFFPLFRIVVFKDIIKEKGIRCVNCFFEADNTIALVAKLLDCPVLSYDSDFYIYGSMYIPFDTLNNQISTWQMGEGHVWHCQIYKIENLLFTFQGLTEPMLPLAAILLGNDYVKHGAFQHFFCHLKLNRFHNQQRIKTLLTWLSRHSLNTAIVQILSRVQKKYRKQLLNIIEKNINSYVCVPTDLILRLGFAEEDIKKMVILVKKPFKFNRDINNLTCVNENIQQEDLEDVDQGSEVEIEVKNISGKFEGHSDNAFIDRLPFWFISTFRVGSFSPFVIDLLNYGCFISYLQVEDHSSPSAALASQDIIGVIYNLLFSGLHRKKEYAEIFIRKYDKLICHQIQVDSSVSVKYPELVNLWEASLHTRKTIIDSALGVTNVCISQIPVEWKLYIMCMKYWIEHTQVQLFHTQCYIYSLLVCMLFDIIDNKIGRYRLLTNFHKKYKDKIESICRNRKASSYETKVNSADELSPLAWQNVNTDDCILAASFFIEYFQFDVKLRNNIKKYNIAAVHAFAEFQNCVLYAHNLNALLRWPYQQPDMHRLYNGMFLYNLYNKLKTTKDAEMYITTSLEKSPSLLTLFKSFLEIVKPLFPDVRWGAKVKKRYK